MVSGQGLEAHAEIVPRHNGPPNRPDVYLRMVLGGSDERPVTPEKVSAYAYRVRSMGRVCKRPLH